MTTLKKAGLSLAVIATLGFGLSGCGSSNSNSNDSTAPTVDDTSIKITGTISGNGYAKNDIIQRFFDSIITPLYALGLDSPNKIVVIDNVTYNSSTNNMELSFQEFDINIDGTFDIDTSKFANKKLVILVVNSTTKKVYGNLNLGTSGDDKLDFIDKSKLIDSLDLGSIDTESNCSTSATVSSVGAFSNNDIPTLEKIAKFDNGLTTYGNYYQTLDKTNNKIKIDSTIEYSFHADTLTNITSQYNDISDFNSSTLADKNIILMSNEWGSLNNNDIKIYPPSAIKYQEAGTNTYNGDANSTVALSNGDRGCNEHNGWKDCGFAPILTIPSGEWTVKVQNEIKEKFQFNDVNPFEANEKLKVPIPSLRINMDGNYIKSVDIKWYVYNGSTYEEATEDIMNLIATAPDMTHPQVSLAIKDEDGVDIQTDTWSTNYPMPSDKQTLEVGKVERIGVEYNIGQVRYYFRFYN